MARSKDEIYNSIWTKIISDPLTAQLDQNTTEVSIAKKIADIVATEHNFLEQIWDDIVDRIESHIAPINTQFWFQQQVLKFQYGDIVQSDDNFLVYYPVIDETKQIIKRCSVREAANKVVRIKVAAEDGTSGNLIPLTDDALSGLDGYVDELKPSGTAIEIISFDADRLMIQATIYYNPQYTLAVATQNVKDAINNYMASLPFDGIIVLSRLEDALIHTPSVLDFTLDLVKARPAAELITSGGAVVLTRTYETSSGYVILEDTPSYTLDDTLTFIAQT